MSLIVCSNKESDATIVGKDQSIFKPYSFRNALSSTMILPKNCQVALESVKYNLDGTVALTGRSRIMYFYYGETLILVNIVRLILLFPQRLRSLVVLGSLDKMVVGHMKMDLS